MLKLKKHQIDALEWLKNRPKIMLALDAGLGKSAIAIKTFGPDERILIICPATLKLNWRREILKWCEFESKVTIIKKKTDAFPKGPGIIIINYDILGKKSGKRGVAVNFDFTDFDRVVLDESHFIKNSSAVRTKIGAKIVKTTENALLLTGTPGERSMDLYVPLYSLGALKFTKHEYGIRFCDAKKVYLGRREVWDYRGSSNTEELRELMTEHVLIMKKEDVIDLPDKTFSVIELDLPVDRREKSYDFKDIKKDPRPIAFEGLAELLHEQSLRKLPLAIQHIKMRLEGNDKIIVIAKHHDVIDIMMEKLEKYKPVKLDGRDSAKEKDKAVQTFQEEKDCRIFIGQIKAAGVGLNLTQAHTVIFVETNWSYSDISQASDRAHRIGQTKNVNVEILAIADSIDIRVLYNTLEKKKFTEEVLK